MKKPTTRFYVALALVVLGIIAGVVVLTTVFKPGAPPTHVTQAQFYSQQKFLTTNQLTWTTPVTHLQYQFRIVVLQNTSWAYQFKPPTENAFITVWDSINFNCKGNAANYAQMQQLILFADPDGSRYSNANSITLGTTPVLILENGIPSIFRLQLYAGDLRIENTNGSGRYWSLFFNPGPTHALQNWPSTLTNGYSQIMFQTSNINGQVLNFVANGDLICRGLSQTGANGNYLASKYKVPPTCTFGLTS